MRTLIVGTSAAVGMLVLQAVAARVLWPRVRVAVGVVVGLAFVTGMYIAVDGAPAEKFFGFMFWMGCLLSAAGYVMGGWTWAKVATPRPAGWLDWIDCGIRAATPMYRWIGIALIAAGGMGWLFV